VISFDQAFKLVLDSAHQLGTELVDILNAANRVLAEDVKSDIDMPPFNKSAMDGYACRRADLDNELTIVETIPAGHVPKKTIGIDQCAKIMTGSMVPEKADCVVMKEYVEVLDEKSVRFIGQQTSDNICLKGEDIKAGDTVLHRGDILKSQHIAILASVGHTKPLVSKRPKVAVIATGNELVEPFSIPKPSQIRNSNSFQISTQIKNIGALATYFGIATDESSDIEKMFKKALIENDVVIVSGGVSVGDYDIVTEVLKKNGVNVIFEKIAVKPGKPTVFGVCNKTFCFGLPGNPVASFVIFELILKPFIYRMMGCDYQHHDIPIRLDYSIKRKKTKSLSWRPVKITEGGTIKLIEYHGSAHISAFCGADGLICFDVGVSDIAKGTIVKVRLI
jgi:molybdopterin molybdotransferase